MSIFKMRMVFSLINIFILIYLSQRQKQYKISKFSNR